MRFAKATDGKTKTIHQLKMYFSGMGVYLICCYESALWMS